MNKENELTELIDEETENKVEVFDMEPEEEEGGSILGKILLVAAGVGVGFGVSKLRKFANDKMEEKNIKKLESKGYIVTKQEVTKDETEAEPEKTEEK